MFLHVFALKRKGWMRLWLLSQDMVAQRAAQLAVDLAVELVVELSLHSVLCRAGCRAGCLAGSTIPRAFSTVSSQDGRVRILSP